MPARPGSLTNPSPRPRRSAGVVVGVDLDFDPILTTLFRQAYVSRDCRRSTCRAWGVSVQSTTRAYCLSVIAIPRAARTQSKDSTRRSVS